MALPGLGPPSGFPGLLPLRPGASASLGPLVTGISSSMPAQSLHAVRSSVHDLQESQQRLLREQTAATSAFIDNLKNLTEEVATLKSGSGRAELAARAEVNELRERMQQLETALRSQGGLHDGISSKLDKVHHRLLACENGQYLGDLRKAMDGDRANHESKHGALKSRIDRLEGKLGECIDRHDKHDRSIASHSDKHDELSGEVKSHAAHHSHLLQRLSNAESLVGEAAKRHAQELASTQKKVDQLCGQLAGEHGDHTRALSSRLEELHAAHSKLAADKEVVDARVSSMHARHSDLEHRLREAEQTIQTTLAARSQEHSQFQQTSRNSVQDIYNQLLEERSERERHHAGTEGRLRYLEACLGTSASENASHAQALHQSIKDLHSQVASELNSRLLHHTSVEERLQTLEARLHESSSHGPQIEAAHRKLQAFDSQLQQATVQLSEAHDTLKTHATAQRADYGIGDRLERLERAVSSQAQDLEGTTQRLQEFHGKLTEESRLREQRFENLEITSSPARERHLETRLGLLGGSSGEHFTQAQSPDMNAAHLEGGGSVLGSMSTMDRNFFRCVSAVIMQEDTGGGVALPPLAGNPSPKSSLNRISSLPSIRRSWQ
eukprot:TRINITY_DN15221_c0_g1_i1.p1 TRINITY_DN15221_c0_g1~~TRINITY_DN15221_c0_g1_i1.p1  ORF type:complete len:619 (-),score=147.02 TRINITY_DN15221_c0_g1_i1:94-1926(-)